MSAAEPSAGKQRDPGCAGRVTHDGSPAITGTPRLRPPRRRTPSRLVSTTLVGLRIYVVVMTTLVVLTLIIALRAGGH